MVVGPFAYWPAAAANGFLAIGWLFAFSAVYKSVSLRILTHLDRVPDHSLTVDAIADRYVRAEFEARARVLMNMGCVDASNGAYTLTEKGRAVARRIEGIRRACGVGGSGLYSESASRERERPEVLLHFLRSLTLPARQVLIPPIP